MDAGRGGRRVGGGCFGGEVVGLGGVGGWWGEEELRLGDLLVDCDIGEEMGGGAYHGGWV